MYNFNLFFEEFLIVFLIYNFLKLIIFNSIFELIWPTHFFNNKHNYSRTRIYRRKKFRNFLGFLLKLRPKNITHLTFYKSYINFFLK